MDGDVSEFYSSETASGPPKWCGKSEQIANVTPPAQVRRPPEPTEAVDLQDSSNDDIHIDWTAL